MTEETRPNGSFTPGPWSIADRDDTEPACFTIEAPHSSGRGDNVPLAQVFGFSPEQNLRDARLIASAPEMLAALQAIAAGLPEFPDAPIGPENEWGLAKDAVSLTVGAVRQVRAAIVKATVPNAALAAPPALRPAAHD
jgi:hypothetical protein